MRGQQSRLRVPSKVRAVRQRRETRATREAAFQGIENLIADLTYTALRGKAAHSAPFLVLDSTDPFAALSRLVSVVAMRCECLFRQRCHSASSPLNFPDARSQYCPRLAP